MKNKGLVVSLTIVITLLCAYYLFFTFVVNDVKNKAKVYATDSNGNIDYQKELHYLDSVQKEPVFSFLGLEYTYKEVTQTALSLGLDLEGGMHVTLEVSPVEIIKAMAGGKKKDPDFRAALKKAEENQKNSQSAFADLFYDAFKEQNPEKKLAEIFANAANKGKIEYTSSDSDVLKVLNKEIDDAVDRSFTILRTRLDQYGTTQPNIQKLEGTGRIQIEIPNERNPKRVEKLLQGVAKLEFWEVWDFQSLNAPLIAIDQKLLSEKLQEKGDSSKDSTQLETIPAKEDGLSTLLLGEEDQKDTIDNDSTDNLTSQLQSNALDSAQSDSAKTPTSSILFNLRNTAYGGLTYNLEDTAKINSVFKRKDIRDLLPRNTRLMWDVKPKNKTDELAEEADAVELYFLKGSSAGKPILEGEVIDNAYQDYNPNRPTEPAVSMRMNVRGAKKWKKITRNNQGKRVAITLDNLVYSAPVINEEIPNGMSIISGNFTTEEAVDLANILKSGRLPAPTRIVESVTIGPTLGKKAQKQGIISMLAGLGIVVLFMIAYYSKGGFIANLALVFNVFFILGILAQLNTSLTLPGIAGIVLTIGMSIDANVLIFERIREELRNGINLTNAIASGYKKAFSSIVDANATTLLTGVILASLGQGPVKNFAITLIIGIFSSFFSAVFITRVIVEWLTRKGDQSKMSFTTPFSKGWLSNLNFDFMGKRRMAYIGSLVVIVIGLTLMAIQGLNLGVDFKGGRAYVVSFQDPIVATDLKTSLDKSLKGAGTEVKNYGANNIVKVTTSYLVDDESLETDEKVEKAIINGIEAHTKLQYEEDESKLNEANFIISSKSKVGATIADDIRSSSKWAVILSLIVIFLYILIRFKNWQYGLGAIVALFHDTLVVLSAFAIAGAFGLVYEVNQIFIAAMLTIIGYSINDTVIVFDRIRENTTLHQTLPKLNVFNLSINNTMSRTLITSLTTLVVVLVLFVFGGEVLRGFSFALLVGVTVGTYSSIFIATPVVADLSKGRSKKNSAD